MSNIMTSYDDFFTPNTDVNLSSSSEPSSSSKISSSASISAVSNGAYSGVGVENTEHLGPILEPPRRSSRVRHQPQWLEGYVSCVHSSPQPSTSWSIHVKASISYSLPSLLTSVSHILLS